MISDKREQNSKHTLHQMLRGVLAKYCDECGSQYMEDDIRIVQKDNNAILLHLSCKTCGKTHLATIMKPLGVTNRMPIKTDLRAEEIKKFAGKRAVSPDDTLDVYEWSKNAESQSAESAIKELK